MAYYSCCPELEHFGRAFKIKFGKHHSKTMEYIWKTDPYYCLTNLRYSMSKYPLFREYIDYKLFTDIELYEENDMRIKRTSVTTLMENLDFYHYIRLYDCFQGKVYRFTKQVHEASVYPAAIIENELYPQYGIFFDLLIRKHVSNFWKDEKAFDRKVERLLISKDIEEEIACEFDTDYDNFKSKECSVMDVLPGMFHLTLLEKSIEEGDAIEFDHPLMNENHIVDVLSYVDTIPNIKNAILNPILDTEYFTAEADMVTEDTIIDFKVSKERKISEFKFLQLIFYAVGYYLKEGKEFRKFIIYNPLLGLEHRMEINTLNFDMLVEVFKSIIC